MHVQVQLAVPIMKSNCQYIVKYTNCFTTMSPWPTIVMVLLKLAMHECTEVSSNALLQKFNQEVVSRSCTALQDHYPFGLQDSGAWLYQFVLQIFQHSHSLHSVQCSKLHI